MISNSEIRARARSILGGNIFSGAWLCPVLALFIFDLILSFLGQSRLASIVCPALLSAAFCHYFLGVSRKSEKYSNFNAFIDGMAIDLSGMIVLYVVSGFFLFLWSLLFVIPGIVKTYSYAFVYHIKHDNPSLTTMQAITESRRLMNGYKMKFFLLRLSFLGWYIVGILTLGIGMLWVKPYVMTASAVFYDELKAAKSVKEENANS
jgi:uncharacterized membrane protein